MSEIRDVLEEQIVSDLETLAHTKAFGTDERKQMIADLDRLYRLYLDDLKTEAEITDSGDRFIADQKQREKDNQYRDEQKVRDRMDKIIGHILTGAGILIPAIVSVWMLTKGWKFEETGTICSKGMNWLFNKQKL